MTVARLVNYPLPKMESLLQQGIDSELMSVLDDFLGYNQVLMEKEDKYKTAFTTPWGTYAFNRMHFGLSNARSTLKEQLIMLSKTSLENSWMIIMMI